MRKLIPLIFLFSSLAGLSQLQEVKPLFQKLHTAQSDTQKINALNAITKIYIDKNLDSALLFNKQSIDLVKSKNNDHYNFDGYYYKALINRKQKKFEEAFASTETAMFIAGKTKNQSHLAKAHNIRGTIYDQTNKNDLALDDFFKALEISKSIHDKTEMLSANMSLGIYFKKVNKTTEALKYLLNAMTIAEAEKNYDKMFTICINLGTMYERTNDKAKAKELYKKALRINQIDKDENDQAIVYYKLGKLFHGLKQLDSARYYLNETLKIHLKRNDAAGLVFDYSNLAGFDMEDGKYDLAEKNYLKALELGLQYKDTNKLNMLYSYLGGLYYEKKDFQKALVNYKISLQYCNNTVARETVMMEHKRLSDIYRELGDYKNAYNSFVSYKAWSDSSYNVSETKKQTELKLNYEFEQTQKKIREEALAKDILNKAELENERKQRNYLLIGLAIISIMLIVTVKNYRAKQKANNILHKQKKEIEYQKKLVDAKNLEISDSINYALRIQTASIPTRTELNNYFKNYDLFFKPKDVVSGDFYWAESITLKNPPVKNFSDVPEGESWKDFSLIGVGDCTGHGVPGAITSMIGSMLLNEIFNEKKIYKPNEVLTELNRLVKLTLRQDSESLTNDGMDIAFCLLNTTRNELLYAGANRPLYIINAKGELTEYKATKVSVGGQVPLIQQYDLHHIQLNTGDTIVISTDGYADQFGGEKEKKYTTKAFKNLLIKTSSLNANDQKNAIETAFNNWKGKHEQTDDILVFILKV